MQMWDILEIEPTNDIRIIKKAYARLSKRYHPEDEPEKWQTINEAYQAALSYAKWQAPVKKEQNDKTLSNQSILAQEDAKYNEPMLQNDTDAVLFDFSALEQQQINKEKIQSALRNAKELIQHYYNRNNQKCWKELLHSDYLWR